MRIERLVVLCGGPSEERGISLNSARSVCDHLEGAGLELVVVHYGRDLTTHRIPRETLYSNTPADFEFKIAAIGERLDEAELRRLLADDAVVFPVIHGAFGEDGELAAFLESVGCPFVGSSSAACRAAFDKHAASARLREAGFFTLPSRLAATPAGLDAALADADELFAIGDGRVVVKPTCGGSSLGVSIVESAEAARRNAADILAGGDTALIEPFCSGTEFTIVVIEDDGGRPVALCPVEVELRDDGWFDYRKKYLPSAATRYHLPPRRDAGTIRRIREAAAAVFELFELGDMARFDGFLVDDEVWFSDLNMASGLEQNSFAFIQGAHVGLDHAALLRRALASACRRAGATLVPSPRTVAGREPVDVLFGGDSAERDVSVMSGTNVWLKLRRSERWEPRPCFLEGERTVWRTPYHLNLFHSADEIAELCREAMDDAATMEVAAEVAADLGLPPPAPDSLRPAPISLGDFLEQTPRLFIALHGGLGEDGGLQQRLERSRTPFTGSGSAAARLAMDKAATGRVIAEAGFPGVGTARRAVVTVAELPASRLDERWRDIAVGLGQPDEAPLIVKPSGDGCSAGVARLRGAEDLAVYLAALQRCEPLVLEERRVEMPPRPPRELLFEEFIVTDPVSVRDDVVETEDRSGWVEVTVGLLGEQGAMRAFDPSITVAEGSVLTLEEKFQGGTGVNLTPPPEHVIGVEARERVRASIEKVARLLGLAGFARIDAFVERRTGDLVVIEANTIPGLTPSTVIYHQALAREPSLSPREFLERVVELSSAQRAL